MERLKSAFGDSSGVSAEREQQPDAVGGGRRTSRVQGGLSTGRQIHLGSAQQQVAQTVQVAAAGRDVQRRGEFLLVGQRPQPCGEKAEGQPPEPRGSLWG